MEEKFDISLYDDDFFKWHKDHVHEVMHRTGVELFKHYRPQSFADFGCGIGSYVGSALHYGLVKVYGCDIGGEDAKKYAHPMVREHVNFNVDLTKPLNLLREFDITFCIEVAEHIDPSGSQILVNNVAGRTKEMCLFTAAPASQDGCGHINTHHKIFWIDLFEKHGFYHDNQEVVFLRKVIWKDAPDYIKKNLMVFKRK